MRFDRRWLPVIILAFTCLGVCYAWISRPHSLEMTFLDVGEGLCVVGRTPSGKSIVFDCGTASWRRNDLVGERLAVPCLRKMGIGRVDIAVLSHPHLDHVSGYPRLVEIAHPRLVLDIGAESDLPEYKRFLDAVKRCGADYRIARRGQSIEMGDGVLVSVLHPGSGEYYEDLNDRSIVVRISYGKTAFLLCADAGEAAESRIMESGLPVQSQVMQVGHHGSETSCSPQWLAAVKPAVAVISCGRGGQGGHPSRSTLDRLQSVGAVVYNTGREGAVTVSTDGTKVSSRAFRAWR